MSDPRLPSPRERRVSRARFRCPRCARFVIATEHGVCPGCGLGPPTPTVVGRRDEELWRRAGLSPTPRAGIVGLALLGGLGVAAAWALGLL